MSNIINPYRFAAASIGPSLAVSLLSPSVSYEDDSYYTDVEDDWGPIMIDEETTITLLFENPGDEELTISSGSGTGAGYILGAHADTLNIDSYTIAAGGSTNADLLFTAEDYAFRIYIFIDSDASGSLASYRVDFWGNAT